MSWMARYRYRQKIFSDEVWFGTTYFVDRYAYLSSQQNLPLDTTIYLYTLNLQYNQVSGHYNFRWVDWLLVVLALVGRSKTLRGIKMTYTRDSL